jgi:hypothetical protein
MADDDNKDGKGNDGKGEAKTFSQEDLNTIVKNRVKETTDSLTKIFDEKFTAVNETISKLTEEKTVETNKSMSDKETAASALKTAEKALASLEEYKGEVSKANEELATSKLDAKDTQALMSAGFGPEGAELLLGKLSNARKVVDGKTVYEDGGAFSDQKTMIAGLTETYSGLIKADRAKGHKVATTDSKVNAGNIDAFQALLAKGDKRTHQENIQMATLARTIKQESKEI